VKQTQATDRGLIGLRRSLALLLCLLFSSVTAHGAGPDPSLGKQVTLLTWWTSDSELDAVNALGDVFRARNPGARFEVRSVPAPGDGSGFFMSIQAAARSQSAPDAVHVNAGAPMRPLLQTGLLGRLDEVWAAEGLEQAVPHQIRELSRIDDSYFAIPIAVHRDNLLWYNASVLKTHGIDAGSLGSWKAVFDAARRMRRAGLEHPFAAGSSWTMSLALEGIVAGLGSQAYEDWINGRITDPADPRLVESLQTLQTLMSYAPPDHPTTAWDAAVRRLASGEAAFYVMGDWAAGEFRAAGLTFGRDYGAVPLPGTRGMYGVTVDALVKPIHTANAALSLQFLRVAASREGQAAFNGRKGSISPRLDAATDGYEAYQRSAVAELGSATVLYPAFSGATHNAFKTGVDMVMAAFQEDGDALRAAAALAALTERTQGQFVRTWSLQ